VSLFPAFIPPSNALQSKPRGTSMREAAALILSGLDAETALQRVSELLNAGIRTFLLAGTLLGEPERLSRLVESLRAKALELGAGRLCIAIGPGGPGLPSLDFEPHPLALAALGRNTAAKRAGKLLGLLAASLGIDLVLTPHVDSVFNPKNPSGVLDSFGDEPDSASRLCLAYIEGINSGGAAACALGFPCSASRSSSFSEVYPVAEISVKKLCGTGSKPLSAAIKAGLGAVLVSRMLVPSMEPEHLPATSSRKIIEGRLRKELGFDGVVIAEVADSESDPGKAVIASALAGCDLTILMNPDKAIAAAATLSAEGALGPREREIIDRSRERMAKLLSGLQGGANFRKFEAIGKSLLFGKVARERLESCVIVKDECAFDGSALPGLILAFTPCSVSLRERTVATFMDCLGKAFPQAVIIQAASDPDPETAAMLADRIIQAAGTAKGSSPAAVLCCNAHFRPEQEALARIVAESFPRFSIIALKDPYDLAFFPDAQGLAAVFGFSAGSSRAVVSLLSGKLRTRSVLPVNLVGREL
ncbi:MAG: glycoside hydrolase family 3 N-terminal domain-containing protein, partial [Rectinemataceae bacterium]|nr:glycoside hydrolase family 3 N-terminal domain-containing protein [Rectinemataceae bacterium]